MLTIAKLEHQLNDEIRDKEIRLIGADGAQLGIMSAAAANAMAEEQGLEPQVAVLETAGLPLTDSPLN